VFTPATAFRPGTTVTVRIPAGPSGVRSAAGGLLGATVTDRFRTKSYSTLRLQELLAQLGYLPLTWTPSGSSPAAGDRAGLVDGQHRVGVRAGHRLDQARRGRRRRTRVRSHDHFDFRAPARPATGLAGDRG
jgi:hypothetical protein